MARGKQVTDVPVAPEDHAMLEARKGDLQALAEQLKDVVITTDEQEAYFSDLSSRVAVATRVLDDRKKAITGPLKEAIRRVDALFKPTADAAKTVQALISTAVNAHRARRVEALRALQPPPQAAPVPPPPPQVHVELVDIRLVPPEFLVTTVDWTKVQQAVYAGYTQIPGFKVEVR